MHTPFGSLRHVTAIINHGLFFNLQAAVQAEAPASSRGEIKNDPPLYGRLYVRV